MARVGGVYRRLKLLLLYTMAVPADAASVNALTVSSYLMSISLIVALSCCIGCPVTSDIGRVISGFYHPKLQPS